MFWTDWEESNPRIERCTLAGNDRVYYNLFQVTKVHGGGWPNGLTADYIAERLYWIDAKCYIINTLFIYSNLPFLTLIIDPILFILLLTWERIIDKYYAVTIFCLTPSP